MPNALDFTFSDLISGYVVNYDPDRQLVDLNTSDGRPFSAKLTSTTTAEVMRNLGDGYVDATAQLPDLLQHGRLVHAYGVFYPSDNDAGTAFEAKHSKVKLLIMAT